MSKQQEVIDSITDILYEVYDDIDQSSIKPKEAAIKLDVIKSIIKKMHRKYNVPLPEGF